MNKKFLKKSEITEKLTGCIVTLTGEGRIRNNTINPKFDITFKITNVDDYYLDGEVIFDSDPDNNKHKPGARIGYTRNLIQDHDLFIIVETCSSCLQL